MRELLCYTREAQGDAVYAQKLADSMHLALKQQDGSWQSMNHNSGLLYAKATQNPDGTLVAKSLKNPYVFTLKDGGFGVIAVRIEADGENDIQSKGKILLFTTMDLLQYQEVGMLCLSEDSYVKEASCSYDQKQDIYQICWKDEHGRNYQSKLNQLTDGAVPFETEEISELEKDILNPGIEGALSGNVISIPDEIANRLERRLTVPINVEIELPDMVEVHSQEELESVGGIARYSDGSSSPKKIDWYVDEIDWEAPGIYQLRGRVHQEHYEFPIAFNRADPCIGKWNGKYYFIATNDADREHSLYIREADSIPELVTAQEILILDDKMYPHLGNLLWAPEFHIIQNRLYIFHAGTPEHFGDESCHVMPLKAGGNPMIASDWEMPQKVMKKDGSPLFSQGITLDMTCFESGGYYYAVWAQRQFVPVDQGSWLYIAKLNPEEPWKLDTDPVLLSMPEYGWANNHTFVDEGPFALITDKKIYLTFSSAAVDSTYVVGVLEAEPGTDLLQPENWIKGNYPLLTSRSVTGQFGTGHNAYVQDDEGIYWNTYHGRPGIEAPRSTGIRRVHFGVEGNLVLDMTEEKDLSPQLTQVSMRVKLKK